MLIISPLRHKFVGIKYAYPPLEIVRTEGRMFDTFEDLAVDTRNKVLSFGITSKSVLLIFDKCTKELTTVMKSRNVVFKLDVAIDWVNNYISKLKGISEKYKYGLRYGYRRTILLLNDNYEGVLYEWKVYCTKHAKKPITDEFNKILNSYTDFLKHSNYSTSTIEYKIICVSSLFLYLENNGITILKDLNSGLLIKYFASEHFQNRKTDGVIAELSKLRSFLEYLEENNLSNYPNLHCTIPIIRSVSRKIVTILNNEQKNTLLQDYHQSKSNFRDKAIYTIALQSGLRFSDIVKIKFNDIDWEKKEIRIIQQKTKMPATVFLTPAMENSIIEYILKERRTTSSTPLIFIKSTGPANIITRSSLRTKNRFRASGIKQMPAEFGTHIMRRTFATDLLNSGASLDVITTSLGHIDKSSSNKYLSTNEEKLKLCSLSIDDYPYNGGLF